MPSSDRRAVTEDSLGAWMLTCNPDKSDFTALRRAGSITQWCVRPGYRRDLMAAGHRVLFWLAAGHGRRAESGVWGAGTVAGAADPVAGTVPLKIELWAAPVERALLLTEPTLATLEVVRQPQMSNPLFVTPEQLAALDRISGGGRLAGVMRKSSNGG
jgi:hypothetical protein